MVNANELNSKSAWKFLFLFTVHWTQKGTLRWHDTILIQPANGTRLEEGDMEGNVQNMVKKLKLRYWGNTNDFRRDGDQTPPRFFYFASDVGFGAFSSCSSKSHIWGLWVKMPMDVDVSVCDCLSRCVFPVMDWWPCCWPKSAWTGSSTSPLLVSDVYKKDGWMNTFLFLESTITENSQINHKTMTTCLILCRSHDGPVEEWTPPLKVCRDLCFQNTVCRSLRSYSLQGGTSMGPCVSTRHCRIWAAVL